MPNGEISRRRAAALLFGAVALVAVPRALRPQSAMPADDAAELARWIGATLEAVDLSGVAAAWRARHPAEASREVVVRAVLAGRRAHEPLDAFFARRVAAEHRAERAELLDGWFLAPTEARLAVLAG